MESNRSVAMDVLLRVVAILVEVIILSALIFSLLWAVRLILFDIGLRPKYKNMVTVALAAVGAVCLVFFIVHLTTFYPSL
jgi:hypothetical protein